jgi:hypothetical protein
VGRAYAQAAPAQAAPAPELEEEPAPGVPSVGPEQAPAPTVSVEDEPGYLLLIGGMVLGAGSLTLNIDSARRIDEGERGCFSVLETGGCAIEALLAGPVGLLGGFGILFYGYQLGEHDATSALAAGLPTRDLSVQETWSLVGLIGGYGVAVAINVYALSRLFSSDIDRYSCEEAARADRADECGGGKILGLSIAQSVGFAVAMISAGPLGYVQGYDSAVRGHKKKLRATIMPLIDSHTLGLAVGIQAL